MVAADVVDAFIAALPEGGRRLAHGQWGVTLAAESAGGWPLDVGLRLEDGLLRAQAFAVPAVHAPDPWLLLRWNRQTRLVRFACTREGDIWIRGDLPAAAVDERAVDRLLGLVVEAAVAARGQSTAGGNGGS